MNQKKRILFIINPISGIRRRQKQRLPELIVQYLDRTKYTFAIRYTEYAGHATELAREAVHNGVDVVVAVGGDGSVNEIGQCLVHTNTALAILPFGSGNGLARHLGIPLNALQALQVINQGKVKNIDVGEFAPGKYFFSNVGVGFAVTVVKWFEHHKVRGFLSYVVAVVRAFTNSQPLRLKLAVDEKIMDKEVTLLNVCNSNQYGYNVGLAPDARLDDGLLDVVVLNKFSRWRFPWYAICILLKKTAWVPHYELYLVKDCRVLNEDKQYWTLQVDGELEKFRYDWEVKVLQGALRVMVP
ncbi:MAG: hypothetical protein KatS3mg031_0105 [Chitinophagales bacterium]|nr:MAG: hypothetical protein KatS3mg031_0105 [Chitinophagales bacterium]